tara:strand:+ start:1899 stop:2051 length:153 start_codon:yes stop_codon:yes gene_type:complete
MEKLQERANELLQEREKAVARVNEINGALQELERQAKELNETTTEEETDA